MEPPAYMRTAQAAEYLNIKEAHLKSLRVKGTGPQFAKLGAKTVVYRKVDLDQWMAASVRANTCKS